MDAIRNSGILSHQTSQYCVNVAYPGSMSFCDFTVAPFAYCPRSFDLGAVWLILRLLVLQRRVESSQLRELAFAMREIGGVVATLIVDDQH